MPPFRGPIDANSTDEQINELARQVSYSHGLNAGLLADLYRLTRRVAVLEADANPPHLASVEKRRKV